MAGLNASWYRKGSFDLCQRVPADIDVLRSFCVSTLVQHSLLLASQFLDRQANHASLGCLKHTDDLGRWYLANVILHRLTNDIAERPQIIAIASARVIELHDHLADLGVCNASS